MKRPHVPHALYIRREAQAQAQPGQLSDLVRRCLKITKCGGCSSGYGLGSTPTTRQSPEPARLTSRVPRSALSSRFWSLMESRVGEVGPGRGGFWWEFPLMPLSAGPVGLGEVRPPGGQDFLKDEAVSSLYTFPCLVHLLCVSGKLGVSWLETRMRYAAVSRGALTLASSHLVSYCFVGDLCV